MVGVVHLLSGRASAGVSANSVTGGNATGAAKGNCITGSAKGIPTADSAATSSNNCREGSSYSDLVARQISFRFQG